MLHVKRAARLGRYILLTRTEVVTFSDFRKIKDFSFETKIIVYKSIPNIILKLLLHRHICLYLRVGPIKE